ncbi:saccharopine dehydrogenase NADP-binding domain-containing protein [Vagococcus carniphilus]|uniref:saccharopine dehydrogenase NADP-binding domain-containing protein n=1 Tax=Vagococcus carniphilus TaxID=218144 RepID=UPI003B5C30E7
MKDKLLLIGGHGAVGRIILRDLLKRSISETNMVIAGRNKEKMTSFLASENLQMESRVLDINQEIDEKVFEDIKLVVMCIDQEDTRLVSQLIALKIDYVDITANSDFIKQVNQLPNTSEVSVITSVGLAPGLTNLATTDFIKKHQAKAVVIDILLGTGESHGEAAVHWMFDKINQPYQIKQVSRQIKNFTLKRVVDFTPDLRKKATYNFNFSDQHILNEQYPDIPITTYFGFDVNLVSNSLHWLNKINRLGLLEKKGTINILKKAMQKEMIGSDDFAIHISSGKKHGFSLYGKNEKEITGKIASLVISRVYQKEEKLGISSIESVCSLEDVLSETPVKMYQEK